MGVGNGRVYRTSEFLLWEYHISGYVHPDSRKRVNVMGNKETFLFHNELQDKIKKCSVGYSLQDLFVS